MHSVMIKNSHWSQNPSSAAAWPWALASYQRATVINWSNAREVLSMMPGITSNK